MRFFENLNLNARAQQGQNWRFLEIKKKICNSSQYELYEPVLDVDDQEVLAGIGVSVLCNWFSL